MKPSKRYKKTYCCNPFVHAAYAHGTQNPKMLKGCRKANGIAMEKSSFYKFGCWKCVGKPAYKNLQRGDVLVKPTHVAMYEVLGEIHDDPDMEELLISALDKLERTSDEEYIQIDFREYDLYMDELDDYIDDEEPAVAPDANQYTGRIDFALPGGVIVETCEGM